MGVRGLTTYLREHRLSTSRTVELFADQDFQTKNVELVVDGWSFIYVLYRNARIPWVYGGEYDRFSIAIERVVRAWLRMGINLSFVFDGAEEPAKFPTCISRLTSGNIKTNSLFFHTSQATRVTPRFLSETSVLPPLAYAACVETLLSLTTRLREPEVSNDQHKDGEHLYTSAVEATPFPTSTLHKRPPPYLKVYFADREADPFMIELAGRLEAFITALDSDFIVFNVVGYKGYIPLDEFVWTASATIPASDLLSRTRTLSIDSDLNSIISSADFGSDSSLLDPTAEDDFVPVKRKRSRVDSKTKVINIHPTKAGTLHRSLLPPDEAASLSFPVYTPASVAQSLGITPTLLPLLGAIVGNDYTNSEKVTPGQGVSAHLPRASHQEFLFEHKMNASQRIVYTANTLSSSLRKLTLKQKSKQGHGKVPQTRVLDLIRNTINQMLLRPNLTTESEVENIVNKVVEGALTYAIASSISNSAGQGLWPTDFCPLHSEPEQCRLDAFLPEDDEDGDGPRRHSGGQSYEKADPLDQVQRLYLRAYREGSLDPKVLDVLITGTMWPRLFLESPDLTSTTGSDEPSGILRRWVYAILDQGIGVFVPPQEEEEEQEEEGMVLSPSLAPNHPNRSDDTDHKPHSSSTKHKDGEDEESGEESDDDEVVDVADEDTEEEPEDPLSALRGALQHLRGINSRTGAAGVNGLPTIRDQVNESDEDEGDGDTDEADDELEPCYVSEYVRRGVRVAEVRVRVEDLNTLIERAPLPKGQSTSATQGHNSSHPFPKTGRTHPVQLQPEDVRLTVLLSAFESDIESVRRLQAIRSTEPKVYRGWLGPVLVARWLIRHAATNEQERESQALPINPLLRRWTKGEVAALLHAFGPEMRHSKQEPQVAQDSQGSEMEIERPDIQDRPIQLMAQVLSVVETLRMLIQVLGLSKRVPLRLSQFKGRVFHQTISNILSRAKTLEDVSSSISQSGDISEAVWDAIEGDLRDQGCFGEDRIKRAKKEKGREGSMREGGRGNPKGSFPAKKITMPAKGGSLFNLLKEMNSSA